MLPSISCSGIDEATPARNFAVLYREQVYEVGPKLSFRITRIAFYVAKDRDVFAGYNEFSRFERLYFVDLC